MFSSALQPESRSASKPLFDKPFNGLTAQQYAYCVGRFEGLNQSDAYREAFASDAEPKAVAQMASRLEARVDIASTINAMLEAERPKTTLVPRVDRNFVLEGITNLALTATKEAVKLRAYELLGKTPEVNLFTAELKPEKPRTIEDIDKELRERLAELATAGGASTIDGTARPAPQPSAADRRRKPKA